MKILSVSQIKDWDEFTISKEPVSSFNLMERAAGACFEWLMTNGYKENPFIIFCGKGNNGGDGLAIARMLAQSGHPVSVYILEFGHLGTEDFQSNLALLHETKAEIIFISTEESIRPIGHDHIVIDALFGSGLNKPLQGLSAAVVENINKCGNDVISIDIPSGMYADKSSRNALVVKAKHTLSFQAFKLAFLMAENAAFFGDVHLLEIGLHPGYLENLSPVNSFIQRDELRSFFKLRDRFAHKGNFGHAALIAGSEGMMGAAVLAARACLRSGAGKLTCHIPAVGYEIMQISVPEAMAKKSGDHMVDGIGELEQYSAIGIGPGLGRSTAHVKMMEELFSAFSKALVIDADGLNCLAANKYLLETLPSGSILTPHPKEFDKLFGNAGNDFERIEIARERANALNCVIVLKGHYTVIAVPDGTCYFNTTGNAGLAKGGSGDVLTGMILALLSQGYTSQQAACLGTWLHGRAADIAVAGFGYESLLPSDCIEHIGKAFMELY